MAYQSVQHNGKTRFSFISVLPLLPACVATLNCCEFRLSNNLYGSHTHIHRAVCRRRLRRWWQKAKAETQQKKTQTKFSESKGIHSFFISFLLSSGHFTKSPQPFDHSMNTYAHTNTHTHAWMWHTIKRKRNEKEYVKIMRSSTCACIAQMISLFVSCLICLFCPKSINFTLEFVQWQEQNKKKEKSNDAEIHNCFGHSYPAKQILE